MLVTSRGERALEVLRDKIPEEVRPLTVALLASDREGVRQFQTAIEAIQHQVSQLNPEITIIPLYGNVITDVGLGLFADVDLVIGCLDNREARLWVNRQCWKTTTSWIDAGIQEIQGVVKVFVPPDSACYECAMTQRDYQLLNLRYSCPLLSRDDIIAGKVPTAPTTPLELWRSGV